MALAVGNAATTNAISKTFTDFLVLLCGNPKIYSSIYLTSPQSGSLADDKVFVDDYVSGEVQLTDLKAMEKEPPLLAGQMIHFLSERALTLGPNGDYGDISTRKNHFKIKSLFDGIHYQALTFEANVVTEMTNSPLVPGRDMLRTEKMEEQKINGGKTSTIYRFTYPKVEYKTHLNGRIFPYGSISQIDLIK